MKSKLIYTLICCFFVLNGYSQYANLFNFAVATSGMRPYGSLISDGTFLYGMTTEGGALGYGTIYKIKPDGTGYVKLYDFENTDTSGSYPNGSLLYDNTFLYGMTKEGGDWGYGTIFKIKPDGTTYTELLDFDNALNGSNPYGSLISDGIYLYGMTYLGGVSNSGTIFKILPDGSGYVKLWDFDSGTDGNHPRGSLIFDGTFLYGMTEFGGASSNGIIFKIKPDGTNFSIMFDFADPLNGQNPMGTLVSDSTFFYSTTYVGGANGLGTIFRIMPDGSGFSKLLDFSTPLNGIQPYGSLLTDSINIFGMTTAGGNADLGTIYTVRTDGTNYSKLWDFGGPGNGSAPRGTLILQNGSLYGMTTYGGTSDQGVVFKFLPIGLGIENLKENKISVFPNPTDGIVSVKIFDNLDNWISISKVSGETVWFKKVKLFAIDSFSIDISNHPSGVYLLRVGDKICRIVKK